MKFNFILLLSFFRSICNLVVNANAVSSNITKNIGLKTKIISSVKVKSTPTFTIVKTITSSIPTETIPDDPTTIISTDTVTEFPSPSPITECLIGQDEVTHLQFECEERYGIFYKKFHPFPDCYSDFVCLLPPKQTEEINSSCIYISGYQYCKSDISNLSYCSSDSKNYDFKACVEKAKELFRDFKYNSNPPLPTPFHTILTETIPDDPTLITTIISTDTVIEFPSPSPSPITECLIGQGEVTHLQFECEELYGLFYKNFHPFPDCYSDFVCLLPPKNTKEINSSCIYISGYQYCKADISNLSYCSLDSKNYDFKACVEKAKELFRDFKYNSNPPLPTPFRTIPMTTTTTTTSTITTTSIPTI